MDSLPRTPEGDTHRNAHIYNGWQLFVPPLPAPLRAIRGLAFKIEIVGRDLVRARSVALDPDYRRVFLHLLFTYSLSFFLSFTSPPPSHPFFPRYSRESREYA